MTSSATLDRLRRMRAAVADGQPFDRADGAWIEDCFRSYVAHAHEGVSLDDAFDAGSYGDGQAWWQALARERRNEAWRNLAEVLRPGASLSAQCDAVLAELRRFERRWLSLKFRQHAAGDDVAAWLLFQAFVEAEKLNPPDKARRSLIPASARALAECIRSPSPWPAGGFSAEPDAVGSCSASAYPENRKRGGAP